MAEKFTFTKYIYDAIKDLPSDIQLEVYNNIMEYVFYDVEPDNSSPVSKSIFLLIKDKIMKKTRKKEEYGNIKKTEIENIDFVKQQQDVTISEEEEKMLLNKVKSDISWKEQGICMKYSLKMQDADRYFDEFITHCICVGRIHKNASDVKNNFTYWLRIKLDKEREESKEEKDKEVENTEYVKENEEILENSTGEYRDFVDFLKRRACHCFLNMKLPTEKEFEELVSDVGLEKMKNISQTISFHKELHKWNNLYIAIKDYG